MSLKRLPVAFLVGGMVLKALLILTWRLSRLAGLLSLLTTHDPGGFFLAEKGAQAFFDQRRIMPGVGESLFFEGLLVIGFGIECLLIGLAIRWLVSRRSHAGGHSPQTVR